VTGSVVVAALAALLLAPAPPTAAQALPSCGSQQIKPSLRFSAMYAGHTYKGELQFGPDAATVPVNLRVEGPAGVVGRVSLEDELVVVTPRATGSLSLTLSWEQRELGADASACSASTTFAFQVHEPVPVTITPLRHNALAYFQRWPCGGAATCAGARRNRFGIFFHLVAGELDRYDRYDWDAADLTPVRVEARAVARARRPGPAVEPAVLEFVPRARQPRRAQTGLVEILRTRHFPYDDEVVEIWVATRPGFFRRGVSVTLTQGTRRLGSFAVAGRCYSWASFGSPSMSCDFKGRHSWIWAPCRKPLLIGGSFRGCYG
jgi:hypothetical protein